MRHNFSIAGLLAVLSGSIGGGMFRSIGPMKMLEPERPLIDDMPRHKSRKGDARSHGFIGRGESSLDRDLANLRAAQMNYKGWCGRPESGSLRTEAMLKSAQSGWDHLH